MRPRTMDAAQGKWEGILSHFGLGDFLQNRHGPCPICGGRDRFRYDDNEGNGTWICNQCGAGSGLTLLMKFKGWDFKEAAREVDAIISNVEHVPPKPKRDSKPLIDLILRGSQKITGTDDPVSKYLKCRGLARSRLLLYNPGVRYHEGPNIIGLFPAMVARVMNPDGTLTALHITYLSKDGRKADVPGNCRKFQGSLGDKGAAIPLTNIHPHLGIAEGIETAIAAMMTYKIHCWAAGTADQLSKFVPPPGVERVSIFGDNDLSFTGQAAAYALAKRLRAKELPNGKRAYEVEVHIPERPGTDFADYVHGDGQ